MTRPNPSYTFGSSMPGYSYKADRADGYRFGFNGKEEDIVNGVMNYGFRIYIANLGRFISCDPLENNFPWFTPFQFAGLKVIIAMDLDGREDVLMSRDLYESKGFQLTMKIANCVDVKEGNMNKWVSQNDQNIDVYYVSYLRGSTGKRGVTSELLANENDFIILTDNNPMYATADLSDVKGSFEKGRRVVIIPVDITAVNNYDRKWNESADKLTKKSLLHGIAETAETVFHENYAHLFDYLDNGIDDFTTEEDHNRYFGKSEYYSPSYDELKIKSEYKNTVARKAIIQIELEVESESNKK